MEKNTALDRLTTLEFKLATIQADIENVAVQARVAGATWEEIGHRLGLSKQTAHARYNEAVKNERKARYAAAEAAGQVTVPARPTEDEFGTLPILPSPEFQATNSPVVNKALVKAVLNGLDVSKEELAPMYKGALEQITVTIREPKGNGWIYLIQTVGTTGRSSHAAYIAYTTGGKPVKLSVQDFMRCITAWGDPAETTQAHTTKENTK